MQEVASSLSARLQTIHGEAWAFLEYHGEAAQGTEEANPSHA